MRGVSLQRARIGDVSLTIDVQSLALGAQSANAFTGWESLATNVDQRTEWGLTSKYLNQGASASNYATVKTKGISRDQEITTWFPRGTMILRWTPGGKAIRFSYNIGSNAYSLQIVEGLTEGTTRAEADGPGYTSAIIAFTLPTITGIPGYSISSTAGHTWTVGAEGFEIYLKYNGTEFFRTTSFHVLTAGIMALALPSDAPTSDYGFRNITAVHKSNRTGLHSNIKSKWFDIRDFGMKTLTTTGSMTAGSPTLTVASDPGFAIGDQICIATGGEAGGGVPGARGVGGQWPTLTYANATARNADTSQPTGKVCGLLDTGVTYEWNGSSWVAYAGNISAYLNQIVPKALVTTITNISGTTFTLATSATVSTTNANVYFDNAAIWTAKFDPEISGLRQQPGCTVYYPASTWVFAGQRQYYSLIDNVNILGAGKTETILLSPTGIIETGILVGQCVSPRIAHMGFLGNTRSDKGYMFRYDTTTDQFAGSRTFAGVLLADGALIEYIRGTNYSNAVSEFAQSANCTQRFIDVIHETGHKQYFQWAVNTSDSENCLTEDINFDCPYLFKGLESFRSNGSTLRRATGRNVIISSNSNNDLTISDCDIIYEEGSGDAPWYSGVAPVSRNPSAGEPLVNLNSNIDNTSGSGSGGGIIIENCDFDVQGRIWEGTGFWLIGRSGTVDNVTIRGKYPDKPVTAPSGHMIIPDLGADRSQAFRSDELDKTIIIENVRISGDYPDTPIAFTPGSIKIIRNCVVDNMSAGGTQTGNITNAAYEAL